ncbi:PadR family transcriptional regulator [Gordonibacter sp. An230]|uniref:PadR family transcriptional regulator n=1 Tax=Gordonibacter sp. An230 TaxID=1965592 RepID=UPI000B3850AA|nr:PadR family transcriptional regulator [Gordonibacter sp. An230]OUO91424.1 PadR family transcriptional regulator [Gordonibacter sp. An230]
MERDDIVSSMVLELRRGTLVMLALSRLREPAYGYALVKSLADHGIPIEANTLYPLMRRLEAQGLLESEWDHGGSKPRKYYRTTPEGLHVLRAVEEQWRVLCEGVNGLLRADGETVGESCADAAEQGKDDEDALR